MPRDAASLRISTQAPWGKSSAPNAPDADLWHVLKQVLCARGAGSVQLSKIKAHLTAEEAASRGVREFDRAGNDMADSYARRASAIDGALGVLAKSLAIKLQSRDRFMKAVHDMMIAILQAKGMQAPAPGAPYLSKGRPIPEEVRPLAGNGTAVEYRRSAALMHRGSGSMAWPSMLRQFLLHREWVHSDMPMPMVAILAAFELTMDSAVTVSRQMQDSSLNSRVSVKELLTRFTVEYRHLIRTRIHVQDRAQFATHSTGQHAMRSLGFRGFMTCIRCVPRLSPREWMAVSTGVIKLRGKLPAGWEASFTQGNLLLIQVQLSHKQVPKWRRLADASERLSGVHGGLGPASITCPAGCGAVIALRTKPQPEKTSWPKVRCAVCKVTRRCGGSYCTGCDRPVPKCRCASLGAPAPRAAARQADLRAYFLPA